MEWRGDRSQQAIPRPALVGAAGFFAVISNSATTSTTVAPGTRDQAAFLSAEGVRAGLGGWRRLRRSSKRTRRTARTLACRAESVRSRPASQLCRPAADHVLRQRARARITLTVWQGRRRESPRQPTAQRNGVPSRACPCPCPCPCPTVPVPVRAFACNLWPNAAHRRAIELDHERLDVYNTAIELVPLAIALANSFPPGYSALADQLRRAATSICLNIAEGAGEVSARDKARFYRMAKRSATESAAILGCRSCS
jgi:hypothetical protein